MVLHAHQRGKLFTLQCVAAVIQAEARVVLTEVLRK